MITGPSNAKRPMGSRSDMAKAEISIREQTETDATHGISFNKKQPQDVKRDS
jgi:hypothetical protein